MIANRKRMSFAAVTRARLLPVLLAPSAAGGAYAWSVSRGSSWAWFAAVLATTAAAALSVNVAQDVADAASGADDAARADGASVATGSGSVTSGALTRASAIRLSALLASLAVAGAAVIAAAREPWIVVAVVAGVALSVAAVAPPIRFASRAAGLAEASAFASAMLSFLASAAAQMRRVDGGAARAAVVPAMLAALVALHQQFLRHRPDRAIGRPNTVSRLGAPRALLLSGAMTALAFGALAVQAATRVWPRPALFALAAALPLFAAWNKARRDPAPVQHSLTLLGATLGATVLVTAILAASVAIAR